MMKCPKIEKLFIFGQYYCFSYMNINYLSFWHTICLFKKNNNDWVFWENKPFIKSLFYS